jgi:7-keto-8-aminopelargonate synthetase-like enzyme
MSLLDYLRAMRHQKNSLQASCWLNWKEYKMLGLGRNKNVGKGSVRTLKGNMCKFGAVKLAYGSYHIGES